MPAHSREFAYLLKKLRREAVQQLPALCPVCGAKCYRKALAVPDHPKPGVVTIASTAWHQRHWKVTRHQAIDFDQ
jgi:hypothetical protein